MPDIDKSFKIWIPQVKDEIFKNVTLTDNDNTVWDLDSNLTGFDITWPTIRGGGVASFTAILNNPERQYLDKFVKGNIIKFYFDYTDGTTLYKQFYIEGPKYGYQNGYRVYLHGRDYPQLADKKNFVYDFSSGITADECFSLIVTDHFSGIVTTGGIATAMTDTITAKYEYKPAVKVFRDILSRINYDGRFENDGEITTFIDTGILSTTEAAILGQNVKSVSGFGAQTDNEKNRTQIIGKEIEDCPVLRMKQNTTQQGLTWIKDNVIKNTSISNLTDAEDVATYKNDDEKTRLDDGTISTIGMATIKPGQQLVCSVPDCKIVGNYFVKKVIQKFTSSEGWVTELDLNETTTLTSTFLEAEKNSREIERELKNPNAMTDTLILLPFSNEEGIDSLSDLTIVDGKLKLDSGISAGTLISNEFLADSNWTDFEIRGKWNDDSDLIEVYISNDGGANFTQLELEDFGKKFALTTTGKAGRLKIILRSDANNPKPELDSIALLIKR